MEATASGRALAGRSEFGALAAPSPAASRAADWPHTTRWLPWGLAGFLLLIWIVPFDSVFLPFGGPVDITLDRPLLLLLGGVWLLGGGAIVRGPQMGASPVHWAFGAFVLVAVLSILVHAETMVRIDQLDSALKKIALLASYGFFFVLAASIIRPSEIPRFVKFTVVIATITAIGVIVENRFALNPFHDWIGSLFPGYTRPFGIGILDSIGRKQVLGPGIQPLGVTTMLVLAMPFAVIGLLDSGRRRQRWLYGSAVLLIFAGALATEKKTGLVGAAAALLVLLAYRPRQMLRLLPFGVVMLVMIHLFTPGAIGGVVDQFAPSSLNRVNTVQDRVRDYDAIRPDLADNPLVGAGWGSYDQREHRILDNLYLTLAIEVGLLGVLAYIAMLGSAFVLANRAARSGDPERAPPAMAAAAAIVTVAVASALLDFLSLPQLAYMFCFVAAIGVVSARNLVTAPGRARAG
jgi:polysaccharide biosynthesis protein PslJ